MINSMILKLLILIVALSSFSSCEKASSVEKQGPLSQLNDLESSLEEPIMTTILPVYRKKTVKKAQVRSGQGLYQALKNVSIENQEALGLINALRDEVEFSKLKVGDELSATFNQDHKLIEFTYSQNSVETHHVVFNEQTNQWEYRLEEVETYWQPRILEGKLKAGSNLVTDLIAVGLSRSVANEIVNVLLCKVNFRMNAREGDVYKVLLNERKHGDEVVGTKVLYTSYAGVRAGEHEAFFYEDKEKGSTYTAHYTEDGQALIRSGLRYPLSRLHVRSGYGWRRHPVTGRRAMHRGVDLKASTGTAVHAVAAGKVVVSDYHEFAGNKVGIKHNDGSTSYYYHLAKRSVKVGDWVRSHQIIGTVGATGRVTGAHLHFGFKKSNGMWMNPLNKRMIATPKLSGERLSNLTEQISKIKGTLIDIEISVDAKYLVANLNKIYPNNSLNLNQIW